MKIEKCPFCGSEAEIFEASEDSFSILCTGCGVEMPYLPYLTEAIAAWNSRADAVPVVRGEWTPIFKGADTCKCSVCKRKGFSDSDYGFIATPYCPNCGAKMEVEP